MSHVLVTGGCGFFGAWIIKQLLELRHRVSVVDVERTAQRWEMIMDADAIAQIAFRPLRIDEPDAVRAAFAEMAPDAVIHLAGLQVPTCRAKPILGAQVNVIGTLAIFEAANALPNKPPVIYASSAAVFGSDADYDNMAVSDASVPMPGTLYGAFKLAAEHCARVYWQDHKLRSVGLRPLTVYGPGRTVGITSFPSRAIAAALLGQRFDIPFSGPSAYTYAQEVADFFVSAALGPADGAPVFTMGGDIIDTPAFIAALDRVVPGAKSLITHSGGNLPVAANLDGRQLRAAYPNVQRIGIAEGIRRTAEIFKTLADRGRLEV